jgi:hypothetical protein
MPIRAGLRLGLLLQISSTRSAIFGHTAVQDSHPVQYCGSATLTPFVSISKTRLGHIFAQALQSSHRSSSITGMYM